MHGDYFDEQRDHADALAMAQATHVGYPQDDEYSMHQGDFGNADLSWWYGPESELFAEEVDWKEEGF
jgi:hypothetical protein